MQSFFGTIIDECKSLMDCRILSLHFVKRSAKRVAHYLTRSTCSVADHVWSVSNANQELIDVLLEDLRN